MMELSGEGLAQLRVWLDAIHADAPQEVKDAPFTIEGVRVMAAWLRENGHAKGFPPYTVEMIFSVACVEAVDKGIPELLEREDARG
jgi:hypothetical protein